MPAPIAKKSVTCPACHSSQEEVAGVISTFCRACGHHFEVREAAPPVRKPSPRPAAPARPSGRSWTVPVRDWFRSALEPWRLRYQPQFDKIRALIEKWRPPQFRRVRCHECARIHEAPFAAASTACPNCNAHIDLSDYLVDKRQSRVVRTRGHLVIKKFGYLNNQLTICGNADIAGGAAGKLFCDGETRIRTAGRLNCEIGSRRVRVEKGADVVVAHPIRVHEMIVRGKLTARVYCNGTLRILKHGFLKGEVHARSITVDKGGLLHAELNIGHFDEVDPDVLGTLQERTCYMAIEDAVPEARQESLPL